MELRVFLAEDLASMHALIGELLSSIGGLRLVGRAATEAEAKLWLTEHPGEWDVCIADLMLDQGSGFGVIAHAAANRGQARIVGFSGYMSEGIRAHCLRLGAEAAFDKADTAGFISWLAQVAASAADKDAAD
ncbi:response regulator [Ramlibacter ginsenosidimutans]|uniref:Response regulator n=1 Tax=Ramlibacter ginsenosidimutans TaxID=502333 RepID=A0A934TRL6_9BURK|nr:response regulator [Ramlibacter ginsenosidimutans]MBK6006312.1 response regulator [Ramlibacter ginsenosidimutans]